MTSATSPPHLLQVPHRLVSGRSHHALCGSRGIAWRSSPPGLRVWCSSACVIMSLCHRIACYSRTTARFDSQLVRDPCVAPYVPHSLSQATSNTTMFPALSRKRSRISPLCTILRCSFSASAHLIVPLLSTDLVVPYLWLCYLGLSSD